MSDESQTYPTKPEEKDILVRFFMAPVEVRSYTNLFYLLLSFPLGIFYFIFLLTGLSVGLGLTIVWIGLPILALVFAASWGMAALERRLAIVMLDAEVPPMTPPPTGIERDLWTTVREFLSNPVTWKGMGYLFLKFPLGIVSFVLTVTLLSISVGFILAPLAYWFGGIFIPFWEIDTIGETLILSAVGVLFLLISMHLLNGLARIWREVAEVIARQPALRGAGGAVAGRPSGVAR